MRTSGALVDLANFTTDMVNMKDIAEGLSRLPRFNGQTIRPYSVAEHSLMVYQIVNAMGFGPEVCMQALMHDATEAFTGDIPAPFKFLVPDIEEAEERLWGVIADATGINPHMHPVIKDADWIALYVEAYCLCEVDDLSEWEAYDKHMPLAEQWMEDHGKISPVHMPHPNQVKAAFHDIFTALSGAIIDESIKEAMQ
jgi:5'-deoxynucleotidase YfbR-like HD superfamily hydrolase